MNVILDTPLSNEEIDEIDAFLLSDATPDDCMDIVTIDGFLTALVIPNWCRLAYGSRSSGAASGSPFSSLWHRPSASSAY
jgi:hypothetical protein